MKMVLRSTKNRYWKNEADCEAISFNPLLKGRWVRDIQVATVYENPNQDLAHDLIDGDQFVKIEIQEVREIKKNKQKAKLVLHHDDSPCHARLYNGTCPDCGFSPDMQSTCFFHYCPKCDVQLSKMICPNCKEEFGEL